MFEFTFSFLAVVCCLRWSWASPLTENPPPTSTERQEQQRHQPQNAFRKLITSTIEFLSRWASAIFRALFKMIGKPFTGFVMRLEIFTFATGNHFIFKAFNGGGSSNSSRGSVDDHRYHLAARYVAAKWLTLSTMERTDRIIREATSRAAEIVVDTMRTPEPEIMALVFDGLDALLAHDPFLREGYATILRAAAVLRRAKAKDVEKTYVSKRAPAAHTEQAVRQWMSHPYIKTCLVNKRFLRSGVGRVTLLLTRLGYDRFVLARAILALARTTHNQRVQRMYDEAIAETAETVDPETFPGGVDDTLFEKLARKFENADDLREPLEAAKKEIASSIDLGDSGLNIDLWPL